MNETFNTISLSAQWCNIAAMVLYYACLVAPAIYLFPGKQLKIQKMNLCTFKNEYSYTNADLKI